MAKSALVEHRPWLMAAVIAAIAFYGLKNGALGELFLIPIKGAACAFLALYALRRSKHSDAKLLAAFLGLSALGDMGVIYDLKLGGALFFAAHLAGLSLFLRNLRASTTPSQKALGVALLLGTPFISWLISGDWQIALYSLALGGMAASAWMSRFPRYRVGIGALLFVFSDWLIFAEMSILEASPIPDLAIWPLYFLAQFLIATGVVQTLRGEHPETAQAFS
ncbi:MAG: lysoplasmalogenase family protein [Erythrobacter sp.]